jgi:hypothetical protein
VGVDALTGYAGAAVVTVLAVLLLLRLGRRGDAVLCALSVLGALVGNATAQAAGGSVPGPSCCRRPVAVSPVQLPERARRWRRPPWP